MYMQAKKSNLNHIISFSSSLQRFPKSVNILTLLTLPSISSPKHVFSYTKFSSSPKQLFPDKSNCFLLLKAPIRRFNSFSKFPTGSVTIECKYQLLKNHTPEGAIQYLGRRWSGCFYKALPLQKGLYSVLNPELSLPR